MLQASIWGPPPARDALGAAPRLHATPLIKTHVIVLQDAGGRGSTLGVGLNRLIDNIGDWPIYGETIQAAQAAATLLEGFAAALKGAGYREPRDVAGTQACL